MGYPFEDLDPGQFERLVVQCMRSLFGAAVQSFAPGIDGGRDARFHGTAERFPSTSSPWDGITIGQAKHTLATNAHFNDPDFSSEADYSVLSKETGRIRNLHGARELDSYILFSNRRLGGVVGPKITNDLAEATGVPKSRIFLAGCEYIDDLLIEDPTLLTRAGIDPVDGPLVVSSRDLAEVILAIAEELAPNPTSPSVPVARVSYDEKNELNAMSPEFADLLQKRYLGYANQIERFLAEPANSEHLRRYEDVVEDFEVRILAKRADHQSFDRLFDRLVEVLVKRDGVLSRNKRLVRAMLFYMYWHCDIGLSPDAASK